jgi:hypothetical protein
VEGIESSMLTSAAEVYTSYWMTCVDDVCRAAHLVQDHCHLRNHIATIGQSYAIMGADREKLTPEP